jgi:hypothetical protein
VRWVTLENKRIGRCRAIRERQLPLHRTTTVGSVRTPSLDIARVGDYKRAIPWSD